jgi:hypothetical protein
MIQGPGADILLACPAGCVHQRLRVRGVTHLRRTVTQLERGERKLFIAAR